jgi:hypothetical protein
MKRAKADGQRPIGRGGVCGELREGMREVARRSVERNGDHNKKGTRAAKTLRGPGVHASRGGGAGGRYWGAARRC